MSKRRLKMTTTQKLWRYRIEKWGWMVFTPIAFVFGWLKLVELVSLLSLWALVLAAGSAEEAIEAAMEAKKANGKNEEE